MIRKLALLLAVASTAVGCADADIRRGDEALAHGRYREAIAFYDLARERLTAEGDDEARDAARGLAGAHRAHAMELLAEGRCAEAREQIAAAEQYSDPVLADHQALHRCTTEHGAPPEARVEDLKRLLALGDHRAAIRRELMRLELELGRDADAVRHREALEARFALTLDDRRDLAMALLRLGRPDEALPLVRRVAAADRGDALMRLKLAELLEERGQAAEAGAIYRALTEDFPRNPIVFLRLAAHLARQGDAEGARAAQARADALRGVRPPPRRDLRPLRPSRRRR